MGWLENIQAATKKLNAAIDGVEQFVQKIVDTKIKKIDDYGNKITADLDYDSKLLDLNLNKIFEGYKEQINIADKPMTDILDRFICVPSRFDLKLLKYSVVLLGEKKKKDTYFSIGKKDTYFTPSDLVLSNSEAAQIRAQINKVGTNQYQDFKKNLKCLDKSRVEQWVLDADAALARWNTINVPEPQLIQTYSLPLKQKALIWDLKIALLIDRRDDIIKIIDWCVRMSYQFLLKLREAFECIRDKEWRLSSTIEQQQKRIQQLQYQLKGGK